MRRAESQTKKQIRRKYKQRPKNASDIFELNSPLGASCLDSRLQEGLQETFDRFREYGSFAERQVFRVLPYALFWLGNLGDLEPRLPLATTLNELNREFLQDFQEISKIEQFFASSNSEGDGLGNFSRIPINGLKLISHPRLKGVEFAVQRELEIDLVFDLPNSFFGVKDHLNYGYFIKRGSVVLSLYLKLKKVLEAEGGNLPKISQDEGERIFRELITNRNDIHGLSKKKDYPPIAPQEVIRSVKVEIDFLNDLRYVPIVSLSLLLESSRPSLGGPSTFSVKFRILPSIPEDSSVSREPISIFRNCVRKSVFTEDTKLSSQKLSSALLPPTPQYNGALMHEFGDNLAKITQLASQVLSCELLEEAMILIKLWSIRWRIWDRIGVDESDFRLSGQLNEETALFLLLHVLKLNKKENSISGMITSSFQLFKLFLIDLQRIISNWKSHLSDDKMGVYFIFGDGSQRYFKKIFTTEKDIKRTNYLHLFNRDYIARQILILFQDQNEMQNVLWRCQGLFTDELEVILKKTLNLIDNKTMMDYGNSISDFFRVITESLNLKTNDTPLKTCLLEFDSCLMVSYPHTYEKIPLSSSISGDNLKPKEIVLGSTSDPKTPKRSLDSIWENCQGQNLAEITKKILERSFTDRVRLLSLREVCSPNRFGCLVGIKFASKITRSIDKGPGIDTPEAKLFKEFWGSEKVETRKFRDGTVLETVLWNSNKVNNIELVEGIGVNEEILLYSLGRHLPDIKKGIDSGSRFKGGCIAYSMTPFGSVDPYLDWEKTIHEEFSNFKTVVTGLTSLPLSIKSIQSSSPTMRFMEFQKVSESYKDAKIGGREEISCVIEMEQSSKWPKTKESIKKIKVAFLLSIQKELEELHSISCDIVPEFEDFGGGKGEDLGGLVPFLDVYWRENIVFRLSIFHQEELANTANTVIDAENMSEKIVENNIRSPINDILQLRNLWWRIQSGARLFNLSNYFPSFRGTVRKLKQFASFHKIPDSEEFLEHVAAYVYTSNDLLNSYYEVPGTSTTGFLRSLWVISKFDWEKNPLIVDLDFQISEDLEKTVISEEEYKRLDKIHSVQYGFLKKHKLQKQLFYVSSQIDPQSLLIRVPSHYNSCRLIHFAKQYIEMITKNSLRIPMERIRDSWQSQPKCDIVILLEEDYEGLIQPKATAKKLKYSGIVFKKQYVNLSSTDELLTSENSRASPAIIAKELFENLIRDILKTWNYQVDVIYDPFQAPYPHRIFLKVRTNQFKPSKVLDGGRKSFLPGCFVSDLNFPQNKSPLTVPNIPLILSSIWNEYSGFVKDFKI
ncbi:NRAP like nucleolar RNA associated protein [Cryptosporidium felis]|nr:NRAP like nucleolar RNA associated protein [Cryptosporidium felis]